MERDDKTMAADLIDLGSVSGETQGPMGDMLEPIGFWHKAGISDESARLPAWPAPAGPCRAFGGRPKTIGL